MFTALLKVPIGGRKTVFFQKGKTGKVVRRLKLKKATATSQDGKYAFFIVDAEIGDFLTTTGNDYYGVGTPASQDKMSLTQMSILLEELSENVIKIDIRAYKELDALLKASIPEIFREVINPNSYLSLNSAMIWEKHVKILELLKKTATSYVSQDAVDAFLAQLIEQYQMEQFEYFANSGKVVISQKNKDKYLEAKKKIQETLRIVCKSRIKGRHLVEFAENTPLGTVMISMESGRIKTSIYSGRGSYPTATFKI